MTNWPKDNQEARNAFYGDPGKGEIARQMVPVVPPFRMTYTDEHGTKVIKSIMFHRKCADALRAALNEIWDYCQHDQSKIDASGASKYFGAYNPPQGAGLQYKMVEPCLYRRDRPQRRTERARCDRQSM